MGSLLIVAADRPAPSLGADPAPGAARRRLFAVCPGCRSICVPVGTGTTSHTCRNCGTTFTVQGAVAKPDMRPRKGGDMKHAGGAAAMAAALGRLAGDNDARMRAFRLLPQTQQAEAIARLAATGMSDNGIAAATQLSVEQIRRILAEHGRARAASAVATAPPQGVSSARHCGLPIAPSAHPESDAAAMAAPGVR